MAACWICGDACPARPRAKDNGIFCKDCKKTDIFKTDFKIVNVQKLLSPLNENSIKNLSNMELLFSHGFTPYCHAADLPKIREQIQVQLVREERVKARKSKEWYLLNGHLKYYGVHFHENRPRRKFECLSWTQDHNAIIIIFLILMTYNPGVYKAAVGRYMPWLAKKHINPKTVHEICKSLLGTRPLMKAAMQVVEVYKAQAPPAALRSINWDQKFAVLINHFYPLEGLFTTKPTVESLTKLYLDALHRQSIHNFHIRVCNLGLPRQDTEIYCFVDYNKTRMKLMQRFTAKGYKHMLSLFWLLKQYRMDSYVLAELIGGYM